jgi:hypothetical protein
MLRQAIPDLKLPPSWVGGVRVESRVLRVGGVRVESRVLVRLGFADRLNTTSQGDKGITIDSIVIAGGSRL